MVYDDTEKPLCIYIGMYFYRFIDCVVTVINAKDHLLAKITDGVY